MGSRLFKHQMAMSNRPPLFPKLILSTGEVYQYRDASGNFEKILSLSHAGRVAKQVVISKDGRYVFFATNNSTTAYRYFLYKRVGNTFTPIVLLGYTGTALGAQFSDDGRYLVIAINDTGGYHRYKIGTDDSFTLIPRTYNASSAYDIAISPDGKYVALGLEGSPYLNIFRYNEDETMVKLPNASPAISASTDSLMFLDEQTLIYTAKATSIIPIFLHIDPVTEAYTRLAHPTFDPKNVYSLARSIDGKYYTAGKITSMDSYRYENATFTKLAAASPPPAQRVLGVSYSPDGIFVAINLLKSDGSAPVVIYRREGDALVQVGEIPAINTLQDLVFCPT